MNTEISSKLSLYDILAMLIPGALIIFWASNVIFGNNLTIDESRINPWIVGVFFTATSYLVGIMYCKFMELLWGKCLIILAIILSIIIMILSCILSKECQFLSIVILIGVTILYFVFYFREIKCNLFKLIERNNRKMIREIYVKVKRKIFQNKYNDLSDEKKNCCLKIRTFFKRNFQEEEYQGKKGRLDHYYEAYAFVAKNTYRNDVHILESQFAFLRSMFGVAFLFLCFLPNDNFKSLIENLLPGDSMCWTSISLLVLLIAIPFVMACIQKKIYEIVWEDYEYLRRVKDDK